MKRVGMAAVLLLSLAACHGRPGPSALAYRRPVDMLKVGLGLDDSTCSVPIKPPVNAAASPARMVQFIGYDACYRFRKPERLSGVWSDELEYPVFFKDAVDLPGKHFYRSGADTLFVVDPKLRQKLERDDGKRHAFRIAFTGRRTLFAGPYAFFRDIVIVDHVEQVNELPAPGSFLVPERLRR